MPILVRYLRLALPPGVVLLVAALSGCAPVPKPVALAMPTPPRHGTVVAIRRAAADVRVLQALGAPDPGGVPLTEIVVRAEDGAIISMMQTPSPGLRVGETVILPPGR